MEQNRPDSPEEDTSPEIVPLHTEHDTTSLYEPVKGAHVWRQRGAFLVCTSCPREHAVSITSVGGKPTSILTGFEDGKPKFGK